jgi:hypothetical protein
MSPSVDGAAQNYFSKNRVCSLQIISGADDDGVFRRLFVSIYESGSVDLTKSWLRLFQRHLRNVGVPHEIVFADLRRYSCTRNSVRQNMPMNWLLSDKPENNVMNGVSTINRCIEIEINFICSFRTEVRNSVALIIYL